MLPHMSRATISLQMYSSRAFSKPLSIHIQKYTYAPKSINFPWSLFLLTAKQNILAPTTHQGKSSLLEGL